MERSSIATEMLRPGLLDGLGMVCVTAAERDARESSPGARVRDACEQLGASVAELAAAQAGVLEQGDADAALERALAGGAPPTVLVVDAAALFDAGAGAGPGALDGSAPPAASSGRSGDPRAALGASLQSTWIATRAFVQQALLAHERGGRVVYVCAPERAGEFARAARAGVENLARTLSVEWARHAITVVAIAPRGGDAGEVAALVAYLASPAGAYFSGCVLDLGGAQTA
jgi:NAD(P)-dependent dehydrogenase (short-subunit alcohol dehydrogenase family)